jgi:O-acetyl-ADP-ribose deacetylase (regulator of RNase III)
LQTRIELEVVHGDITKLPVDAIVNAANNSLLGGGGVDGAIHWAAGPELRRACQDLHGCVTGSAKATPGFNLPSRWVFHAVGPVWRGGTLDEEDKLAGCYRVCLSLAARHLVGSIAFPGISTGIFGFPKQRAAEIAVATVRKHAEPPLKRVVFCAFDEETARIYRKLLEG